MKEKKKERQIETATKANGKKRNKETPFHNMHQIPKKLTKSQGVKDNFLFPLNLNFEDLLFNEKHKKQNTLTLRTFRINKIKTQHSKE